METREWKTIDKSEWPDGSWQDEPDKKQWKDAETGLPCLIVREPYGGHLCGYVGITRGHPFFGIPCQGEGDDKYGKKSPGSTLDAHGGLNFSGFCSEYGDESKGVCHAPGPGETDRVWWFGFDCAHLYDVSPGRLSPPHRNPRNPDGIYRDLFYVEGECRNLAHQLSARKD